MGKADQLRLYLMGDTIEVFLKPAGQMFYWEIYGAANQRKTLFFYPSRGRKFVTSSADLSPEPIRVATSIDETLNNWRAHDRGWILEMAIPAALLTKYGTSFGPGSTWTIMVGRQNNSADLPLEELSTVPKLPQRDFHLYESYAPLIFKEK